jgi:predicted MFS family arabinose efflux permease
VGLMLSGDIAAALSWRVAFWALALPGLVLAWVIWRHLPEPARDGSWRLPYGAQRIRPHKRAADKTPDPDQDPATDNRAGQEVRKKGVDPRPGLVLEEDLTKKSLWWAVRYVLLIPTNRVLIVSSALGFFFFSGLRTFAVVFLRGRYHLGQGTANMVLFMIGIGAIVGVLAGGRIADLLLERHRVSARPVIAGICFLIAVGFFLPGLSTTTLLIAAPLFFIAAAGLGGANPPLDAARLDLMPGRLWGRAEAVRTVLRYALGAAAPVLFGLVSAWLGGTNEHSYGAKHPVSVQGAAGLADAFSLMLFPLFVAGLLILFWARGTYPRDVATAVASDEAVREHEDAAA